MWMPPLASPGNIDWRLIVPQQQAFGIGSWVPIIKPGNSAWLYVYMVGGGSGGSGGATGAAGTARAGGGAGINGRSISALIPWATLPDVIYACVGRGGTGGGAALGNGGAGEMSTLQIEPVSLEHAFMRILQIDGGLAPAGTTGASASAATSITNSFCRGIVAQLTDSGSTAAPSGGATGAGTNMNGPTGSACLTGASGAGTTTGNVNAAGGGLFGFLNNGPGQIIGSTNSSGGDGGGAAAGGAGKSGKELGQGPGSPLDLFMLTGNSRPLFFCGGCGGGSNGASGVGGKGGNGDWGAGGGGGGAGVTGGVGGNGGDGFVIIGNF